MKKKRYNQFINKYFNYNKYSSIDAIRNHNYCYDDNKHIFLLTNSYSIVRINFNFYNKTLLKRYNELDIKRTDAKTLENQVINFFEKFSNEEFCNIANIKEIKDNYIHLENNDVTFNLGMVKNIANLISKNNDYNIYTSEKNKQAICISGNYGYAYLLGCKTF